MEARASAKYLRGSAQKARLVVDMIRGKRVGEALAILQFTNKRAAGHIEKCLRSAIANATEKAERNNVAVDPDDLVVKTCFVDMGPTKHRRRVRPAPQGRAYREQRHFCHVTVLVASEEKKEGAGEPYGRPGGRYEHWDRYFHSRSTMTDWQERGGAVSALVHETNDFYRLLDWQPVPYRMTTNAERYG